MNDKAALKYVKERGSLLRIVIAIYSDSSPAKPNQTIVQSGDSYCLKRLGKYYERLKKAKK